MIARTKQAPRPFSRLDNIRQHENKSNNIPKSLNNQSLPHKPLQPYLANHQDKENLSKTNYKLKIEVNEPLRDQSYLKKVQDEVQKFIERSNNKICFQNQSNLSILTEEKPLAQKTKETKVLSKSLDKSEAERTMRLKRIDQIKERISRENAENQEKNKRRKSIGEDAYVPFDLNFLKQKVFMRKHLQKHFDLA